MRKSFSIVMLIVGFALLSCGGGGGGGSGNGNDDSTINIEDYVRDKSKIYTFRELQSFTAGDQVLSDTRTKVYSYGQVSEIPEGYGDFGEYPGPYYIEILSVDGEVSVNKYTDTNGNIIVQADQSTFSRIYDNDYSGEGLPYRVVIGRSYASTARITIYNSDLDAGSWGEELGFSVIKTTLKPLSVEEVTVPAGSFSALKFQITETNSVTLEGETTTTVSTGYQWMSENFGLIKSSISFPLTVNGLSGQYTITDELVSVNDG